MSIKVPALGEEDLQYILDQITSRVTDLSALLFNGSGTPNGFVTASPPALYLNRAGGAGTTLWVKESGVNTNTGWVGK